MITLRRSTLSWRILAFMALTCAAAISVVADVQLGERADWLRGSWGINWKPAKRYNGFSETLTADRFLEQIAGLRTLDYIQLHLNESHVSSPVHWGPHEILESLWQGDTDTNGNPINLVVPRTATGVDPFLEMLKAVKAAGLKNQVYVNSSNMLERGPDDPNPEDFPNITERWKAYCDANFQGFINSQSYHTDGVHPERPYMFCYAEFVLKEYAIRYGDLIDGWLFDSGRWMWQHNGDVATSGVVEDQRIYQAFADAVHAGNPNAAVAFNNSPGSSDGLSNPFTPATRFDDYMFGHPFQGGKQIGDHDSGKYDRNYSIIQWIVAKNGYVHFDDGPWTWDDNVVGHFDPPMSTSAWNAGGIPALTDAEFLLWNREALMAGGAMSWGASLNDRNGTGETDLLVQDWAMTQLTLLDEHLSEVQFPDHPNWARAETPLPDAYIGQAFYHTLVDGVDYWDTQGGRIPSLFMVDSDDCPSWLTVEESNTDPGVWILSGIPTEASPTEYSFRLRVENASSGSNRRVQLKVNENSTDFMTGSSGYPVWVGNPLMIPDARVDEAYTHTLIQGLDFQDHEGNDLNLVKTGGAPWLEVNELTPGLWQLSGTPPPEHAGLNSVALSISDGIHSTETMILLSVDPAEEIAQIMAAPDTDYGTDTVATMLSDIQTAYDGLATFQVSIDVVPMPGGSIRSGDGGGATTAKSWGIFSPDETSNARLIFNGDSGEFVESIGNIQIVNFNDGGGSLSQEDIRNISFKSITIVDAQSGGKDSVYVTVDSVSNDLGNLGTQVHSIDLESLPNALSPVTHYAIGTSTTSAFNKWSVNSIEVTYSVQGSDDYSTWVNAFGLSGNDALPSSDSSDYDGFNNLAEFALGTNPTQADAGSQISVDIVTEGGSNYLQLVYKRRSDFTELGLSYLLYEFPDLIESNASISMPDHTSVVPSGGGYEEVSNRYSMNGQPKFVRLMIAQD